MIIHQIYIDIGLGKYFKDNKLYKECFNHNKQFIKNSPFQIKIWNEKMLDKLIERHYPSYLSIYNSFPNKFYKIDFMRPFILHYEGGIYLDMDNKLTQLPNLKKKYILANWENEIANDLIYFKDPKVYLNYIHFMCERIEKCKMPETWKVRRFQYSVGQKCFHQFCKKNGYLDTNKIYDSYYTGTWLKAFDKKKINKIN